MNQKRIRKMVLSAVFCALVFSATWISVPAPAVGNVNLGDGMLLLCAWTLGGPWAVVAAALGSALTDLMGAYAIYAPATLLIKALMATLAILLTKAFCKLHLSLRVSHILSALAAEIVMAAGYFFYEALFLGYGWGAAANIPFNCVQGLFGIVLSVVLFEFLSRAGILHFDGQ